MTPPTRTKKELLYELNDLRRKLESFPSTDGVEKDSAIQQVEAALQESEKKYHAILETIEDGYYEVDLDGRLTFFNDAMARINGYSSSEMTGMKTEQYTDTENTQLLFRDFSQVFRTGIPLKRIQYEVITHNGEKRILETSASLMQDSTGKSVGFRGISRDVTDLTRAQKALSDSEKRFRIAAESANDFIYEWDVPSGQIEWFGAAVEKLGGLLEKLPATAIAFDQLIHPEDAERISKAVIHHLKTGAPYLEEYRMIGREGKIIHFKGAGTGLRDEKGRVYKWIGVLSDITKRKNDEETLKKSIERFQIVAESSNDFIYEGDIQSGQINGFGGGEEKLTDLLETIPHSMTDFFNIVHPEDRDRASNKFRSTLKKDSPYNDELRVIGKGGDIVHLTISGSFLRDERGRAYKWIGALSDITKRKKNEEELKLSLDKLHKVMGGVIQAMVLTVESRDPYTAGHQQRVSRLGRAIAQEMGLPADQIEAIRMAGAVHDLGKISVPAEILSKPTRLSDLEFKLLKVHPQTSYEILKDIDFPWPIARIALQHHERMDGSGYPAGLKGDEILIESQILMVADVVEAIASNRPYRPALGIEIALKELSQQRGKLYNPVVADACLKLFIEKGFSFD
jgi:PAS domain S-box-containing protein